MYICLEFCYRILTDCNNFFVFFFVFFLFFMYVPFIEVGNTSHPFVVVVVPTLVRPFHCSLGRLAALHCASQERTKPDSIEHVDVTWVNGTVSNSDKLEAETNGLWSKKLFYVLKFNIKMKQKNCKSVKGCITKQSDNINVSYICTV